MTEYIDKEAALNALCKDCNKPHPSEKELCPYKFTGCADYYNVFDVPAADVKPVVRGRWTRINVNVSDNLLWVKWECSKCGYLRTEGWEHTVEGKKPTANLCEMCGADMRGVANV